MADKSQMFDAPIPGANYTSDTKNYPWHRPPEITNLDDAIEVAFKKLTEENAATGILTMIEMGATVASLTHTFVMSGIGAGKWTPDFAILLAGPVSHIIYLMAKGYGLDPDMGLDQKVNPPTKSFFKATQKDRERMNAVVESVENAIPSIQEQAQILEQNAGAPVGGFAAMAQESPAVEAEEEVTPEVL